MGTSGTAAATLRSQGLQFVRVFQGALRLTMLYSVDHEQVQAMVQRALTPLGAVLKETPTLSVAFQFDRVLLNSVPVADPSLAPLAAELAKRRVGFLVFSEGIDEIGLARVLTLLATKPETIEERGGLTRFLRANPLEHARIVPIEMAAEDGSLAVVTSAEEASAMARIPRWLLRALHDVESRGETQVVAPQELAALADSLAPELTPEQRLLLPRLQELLVRVVQHANTPALSDLIRSAVLEVGAAGEELFQSVLLQGLTAAAESGELPQAERILRVISELRVEPESLLQMVPQEKVSEETRQGLFGYTGWLRRPMTERLDQLSSTTSGREFRWLVLEVEQAYQAGKLYDAAELLLPLFAARAALTEAGRAETFTRGRYLLAQICSDGLPFNAENFLEIISTRVREETSAVVATPLVESLVVLTQTAAQREEFPLAIESAGVVAELGEEFSARGRVARQAESRLLKPATLRELVRNCVSRKDDPTVSRYILPLLKRVGDPAARELIGLLEKEPLAARRLRILAVVKLLGKAAAEALSEKISDPQWYVVRNAVVALAELADPALLERLEPALSHPDERVQQAAVSAVLKTRSPGRGLPLARALPAMKPAVLETVLDDLLVLKEPQAVPHLENFLRQPADDRRPHLLQKAVAALWAIGTTEAVRALLNCAQEAKLERPLRLAALRALGRLGSPSAREALGEFVQTTSEAALAEEAHKLLS